MISKRLRQIRGEDGSVILAMLAVLVVTAMVGVTFAAMSTGQEQARFDEGFEQALQVAETGLGQMESLVKANPAAATAPSPITQTSADGSTWTASAVKSGLDWTITATGTTPDGTDRTVQAMVKTQSLFNLAAFGKFFADFNGGNGADSFNSANVPYGTDLCKEGSTSTDYVTNPTASNASDVAMCNPTGKGTVGTNGRMKLKGQTAASIDRAEIHFAREVIANPKDGATGYCDGVPALCAQMTNTSAAVCDATTSSGDVLRYCREPIELPAISACAGSPTTSFLGTTTLAGGVHYFTDVKLLTGTPITGTATSPTIICMTGKLTIPNGNHVNFQTGPRNYLVPRPSPSLIILSKYAGADSGLQFGNHASISAAIYAPDASFQGGAQGNVYGSLVASSIDNNGGWNFHYDEALADVLVNAPVARSDWIELP